MANEKKPSFFGAQWEGWKAKALYDFAKFALGAALLSYFGPAAFNQPFTRAVYLFVTLIGLYFMMAAFLFRKKTAPYDPRLASALLRMDAEVILQRYKELDFDHREESRLPLAHSSWPEYGKEWGYVDVSLCTHARMVNILILKTRVFWMQMEYKEEPKLFSINEYSLLYQVIDALEDLQQRTIALHKD